MTTQGGIVEYASPSAHLTMTAGAAVTGGQLVFLSGNRTVTPTTGNLTTCIGVALFNAASGDTNLTVATAGVWPLTASGAITFGDLLVSAAAGAASTVAAVTTPTAADVTSTRALVGQALESIANAAQGRCKLQK